MFDTLASAEENFQFNDDYKPQVYERFDKIRKELVLQNVTIFNEKSLNPINCIDVLVDILYLINQGNVFTQREQENIFFSVTKLLNSQNEGLKRSIFLFLNHWTVDPNTGFILTGPLGTFIQGNNNMLKVNAFKLLGKVVDVSSMSMLERFIKTGISSKQLDVSSASTLCTLDITLKGNSVAKSWIGEINDRLNSVLADSNLLAFHTLLLLREIKSTDKLYLLKTYINLCNNIKSQFANCQLIRYISELLVKGEIEDKKHYTQLLNYLENCCSKHNNDSIILEAVRAILKIPNCKNESINSALVSLKQLLNSFKKSVSYGALKTLDEVATKYSYIIALDIFLDLEKILETPSNNISFKALSLSIFLKVSKSLSEHRLERMLKTITEQYALFKEDFKKEIVFICRNISQTNPSKYKIYFNFFLNLLKQETHENTKIEIINSIYWFITNVEEYRKEGLLALAEYIEDCKYESIKTKILIILGNESANVSVINQIVRCVYNRIILETPVIRAAAVSALGIIARNVDISVNSEDDVNNKKENEDNNEENNDIKDVDNTNTNSTENARIKRRNANKDIKKKIVKLIKNCINDSDHEIRERALYYYKALSDGSVNTISDDNENNDIDSEDKEKKENNKELNNRIHSILFNKPASVLGNSDASFTDNIISRATFLQEVIKSKKSFKAVENPIEELRKALENSQEVLKELRVENNLTTKKEDSKTKIGVSTVTTKPKDSKLPPNVDEEYLNTSFYKSFGNPLYGTTIKKLNDDTSEYKIRYKKYVYNSDFIILVFQIENTIEDVELKNISLSFNKCTDTTFLLNKSELITIDSLKNNETRTLYAKLCAEKDTRYPHISFNANFVFDVQELDNKGTAYGDTYKDSYALDKKIEVSFSDFLRPLPEVQEDTFFSHWENYETKEEFELADNKMKLPYPNIKKAVNEIIKLLGIYPVNSIEGLDKHAAKYELLFAYGSSYKTVALMKFQMKFVNESLVSRLCILSNDSDLPDVVDEYLTHMA